MRDGFTSEPGAQVLSSSDRSLRRLLQGAGLEDELLVLRSGGVGLVAAGFVHELHGSSPGALLRRPGVGLRIDYPAPAVTKEVPGSFWEVLTNMVPDNVVRDAADFHKISIITRCCRFRLTLMPEPHNCRN